MNITALWSQCVSCCRAQAEDDEDTKLCQLTFTLNCCAHHNATTYTVTDGAEEEEAETDKHDDEGEQQNNDDDGKENQEGRRDTAKDLLQHTASSSLR